MVLNMISTASMVRTGKCYKNLMVDVVQTNAKLESRAQGILMEATGLSREEAKDVLKKANGSVKRAVVMTLAACSAEEADRRLESSKGHVRDAVSRKDAQRSSVDFPEPDGPMMEMTFPRSTEREISFSTT